MRIVSLAAMLLLCLAVDGCRPEPDIDQLAFLHFSFDLNGEPYEQKLAFDEPNVQLLLARIRKDHGCTTETIWISISKVVFEKGLLRMDFNIPGLVNQYAVGSYRLYSDLCEADSVRLLVALDEQPEPMATIDRTGIAAYELVEGADNSMEVTHFDGKQRQIEAKFQAKVARIKGIKNFTLPIPDTLAITNGWFKARYQLVRE